MTLLTEIETDTELGLDIEKEATSIINHTLDVLECPWECEINLTIVDNEGIHALNRQFRDIDRPTDVLSFPLVEYDEPGNFDVLENQDDCFNPDTGELLLGDIVISAEKVLEQAEEYGHSVLREFCFLIVHSMLHLSGYDHMEDDERAVMEDMQRKILDSAGITR